MKRHSLLVICFIISILPFHICASEVYDVNISQVIIQKGLSQNTVRTVAVDGDGFIWIGTMDGLNRYDGYSTRSYLHLTDQQNNITDHRIRKLFTDNLGSLWVMTYKNEICYYNKESDSFTYIKDEQKELLCFENIYESSIGDIWLWKGNDGIMRLRRNGNGTFDEKRYTKDLLDIENTYFLLEDSQKAIWIGTQKGLYIIDQNDVADKRSENSCSFTQAILLHNQVYFSSENYILKTYNDTKNKLEDIATPFNTPILYMAQLTKEKILFITSNEIWEYNVIDKSFNKSPLTHDKDNIFNTLQVHDNKGGTWFYNQFGFVWYCDGIQSTIKKINLTSLLHNNKSELTRQPFVIDEIMIDSDGVCWIPTYGYGVYQYNPDNEELKCYMGKSNKNEPSSDYLLSITEDSYGNIWIGSEYTGLIKLVKNPQYISITHPEEGVAIGKINNVRSIYEDLQNNIWVGLKNGGLYRYDVNMKNGKLIQNIFNPYSLVEDNKQRLWIASKGEGVYLYDLKSERIINHFKNQPNDQSSLSNDQAFHILRDNQDRIWIATFGNGLNLVEDNNGKITFRNILTNRGNRSLIRYLYQDLSGNIWAATSDGLVRFDPNRIIDHPNSYLVYRMSFERDDMLSSNDIKTIYQDKDSTIWIGTAGGGLNKFIEATPGRSAHFEKFTTQQGLPDNYVLGILEYQDDLWLSNESGLSRFNKKDNSVATYQFAQMSYGNMFNEGANLMLTNDIMVWGNLDGLLLFNPAKFNPDTKTPPVFLTGLKIDGIDSKEYESISPKAIGYTDKIKLNYKQNIFTIEFATLNLLNPDRNKYTYILENYDKDWSVPNHSNTATYKNLSPGNYIFKVKGANSYGIWNDDITTLVITITPPFWKSTWAYMFYAVFIMIILFLVFKIILKLDRLNRAIEMEQQLTRHKLRFFTNISHEFRTPLTLIQGAIENLNSLDNVHETINKQLRVLNRNSLNLSRLIDQLLEFRKIQNDVLRLDLEETDIVTFAKDIFSSFEDLSEKKMIDYTFTTNTEQLYIYIDRKKIDKIIYNLLSNSFKFTPKEGRINLSLQYNKQYETCILAVKDSGIGIPKEKQPLIFKRFAQINQINSGTGVGLSLVKDFIDVHKGKVTFEENETGRGSVFKIELSTNQTTYDGENFITTSNYEQVQNHINENIYELEKGLNELDESTLENYNLLIIDDNYDILNFLTDGFSKYLHVDTACDGKEGLQKAIDSNPDLIICDVMMPEMDGFEVVRQLKSDFQTCHIPIILLTAHSSNEHRIEGIENGADDYIIKPFSLKYVQKRVMKMIEQREQLKKRFSNGLVIEGSLINGIDKNKEFFDKIETILDANYQDSSFTIEKFVELSGVKRTIFYKKVKGITGLSPNELIKIKRLNKSALLLKESDFIVSEVAYAVGFEDPFYFSKCFKTHFNCTPTDYKKGFETLLKATCAITETQLAD